MGKLVMSPHRTIRVWNRRDVLAAGCALAGTLGLGRVRGAEGPGSRNQGEPFGPFKMGLQSYSLRGLTQGGRPDLAKALAATKELGVHYWESYPAHMPTDSSPQELESKKREIEAAGVTVAGYGVVHFGKDDNANRRIFEF